MLSDKKVISVITARSGSSLVGKNYRYFLGKPLFEWSLISSVLSDYVDITYVSTNCSMVKMYFDRALKSDWFAARSSKQKVILIDRPDEISGPKSMNEEALIHALNYDYYTTAKKADWVVNLQPTSPVRQINLIDNALDFLVNSSLNSLMTVKKDTPFFVQQMNSKVYWHYDPATRPMRQDLKSDEFYYKDDGCLYITAADYLENNKCRLSQNPYLLENDKYSSYQIDDLEDFDILECMINSMEESGTYVQTIF